MPSKKPLLHVVIDKDLLDLLDDYRFKNRFPSRSAALIAILRQFLRPARKRRGAKPERK